MSVADIFLPYYFRLANTAALLIEGPLQLYSTQHITAQHKAIIPTPNPTTAQLAGGKRSHDGCQPGTLCGHRDLCSDTLVARLSSLSCLDVLLQDDFAFLDNISSHRRSTCTAVLHVRQCTTSGLPHKNRHLFRALKMNLARGQARLCCCDFIFNARRHTPTTTNGPRVRSSDIDFQIDSLLIFFSVS